MSSQDNYDNNYDNMPGDAGGVCDSGRAQSESWHVTACQGPKDWRTDKFDRETLFGPINFDGRARPLEKRKYISKRRRKREGRVEKPIPKNFYGYKKVAFKKKWIKCFCSQGNGPRSKSDLVMGWRHPTQDYISWAEKDKDSDYFAPAPVTVYKWVSTAKPYPVEKKMVEDKDGNEIEIEIDNAAWIQRTYPADNNGNVSTAFGLMSKRGKFKYSYVPPPEPVKKKIREE